MLRGGVIMDVVNAEQVSLDSFDLYKALAKIFMRFAIWQARIAEAAGACAVMALERVPSDIRKQGGVARMSE